MKVSHRLCIFLASISIPLIAQTPEQSPTPTKLIQRDPGNSDNQITLDVVVTDKSGKPQAGLQQQNFTLLDNKSAQKILSFQAVEEPSTKSASPLEVVLFIDIVNTEVQTVSNERLQLAKYLHQNNGKLTYPTSIVVATNTGMRNLGEPTLDGNALADAVGKNEDAFGLRTMHRAAGGQGMNERYTVSLRNLYSFATFEARKPGRKMVIWLSPGWPLLASTGAQMYSEGKDQLFSTLVLVSTAIQQARMTLYSIDTEGAGGSGLRSRFSYESYLKGIANAKDVMPPNLSLPVLVTHSGGRVLTTGNDIGSQIKDCISDTKAFYVLTFKAIPTERSNDYHALELKVDKPGLTVRTDAGYYAQPDQSSKPPEKKKE